MCGIFGYISIGEEIEHSAALHALMKEMAIQSEVRGTDATGFSSYGQDGLIIYDKMPYRARTFTDMSSKFLGLKNRMPRTFIGHTRRVDNSHSPSINNNNHPFSGKYFNLIHNGSIPDWKNKAFSARADVKYGTDSELYLRIIEDFIDENGGANFAYASLKEAFDKIGVAASYSKYALAMIHKKNGSLILGRNVNPINYTCTTAFGGKIFIFASTDEILRKTIASKAIDKIGLSISDFDTIDSLRSHTVYVINPSWELKQNGDIDFLSFPYNKVNDPTAGYVNGCWREYETSCATQNSFTWYDSTTESFKEPKGVIGYNSKLDGFYKYEIDVIDKVSAKICSIIGDMEDTKIPGYNELQNSDVK